MMNRVVMSLLQNCLENLQLLVLCNPCAGRLDLDYRPGNLTLNPTATTEEFMFINKSEIKNADINNSDCETAGSS